MASSIQDQLVGWVNQEAEEEYDMSKRLSEYMVMATKRKQNVTEVEIPNAGVLANVCGKSMWLWVDSGSFVFIFSLPELKPAMGKAKFHLIPRMDEFKFLNYNNNRIHILGKAEVKIELNGSATQQKILVIAGNHESILGAS